MKYTEGEKKVIENFKYWIQTNTERGVCTIPDYICINALNLLGKQQKEIERLQNKDKEYIKIENNNLEWQKKYNELKKATENSRQFKVYISGMRSGKELLNKYINDSIPKDNIREKIKELQNYNNNLDDEMVICTNIMKMQVLDELLGDE